MRLCKNSTDAKPSAVQNYIFVSGYSTYYCRAQEKFSLHPTITEKNTFQFLATALLSCIGLRKNETRLDPHRKKNSSYSTSMVHGTKKNSIGTRPHLKNIFSYSTVIVHRTWKKISSVFYHHRKKMFIATVVCSNKHYKCLQVHETQKLLFGIILIFNENHGDPI